MSAHGSGEHESVPDPECWACQQFDPRVNPALRSESAHRQGLHMYRKPVEGCALCFPTPRAEAER